MRKRILSGLIVMAMMFSLLPQTISFAANVNDSSVFLKQNTRNTCTLCSATMMLRRRALLEGNGNWNQITESAMRPTAWAPGLRFNFTYAGYNVSYGMLRGSSADKKNQIINLLNSHPEGIVVYMYGVSGSDRQHAVLATDYDSSSGTLYVADPANGIASGRIPITSAYLVGSNQDARIGNLKQYWCITGGTANISIPDPPAPAHTHSWTTEYKSEHPHRELKKCTSGCGDWEYTGKTRSVSSCRQCYPLGTASLTRSFDKVHGTATFYRNNVKNASSYTLVLYRNGSQYGSYNMSGTSKSVTGLPSGNYTASLTFKNTSTGETKTASCSSFRIVDTYNVSYNANGGTNAPSSQTKIQDETLTLTSSTPRRAHYIFKGWASSKTAKDAQYAAGSAYTKNAQITLYAVWEPEIYTIRFDANGGKGELTDTTITYGNTMRMPNSVIKEGFFLKGWSTNKDATTADYRLNMDYKLDANTTLYAVWGSSTWGGSVANAFAGGDGTEQNPYQISNAAELAYLAKTVNESQAAPEYKHYILTDNISLGYEEWVPIGVYDNENQYFKGSFDGNGYTISDLSISNVNSGTIGIFGYTKDSTVKNITVTGDITGISGTNKLCIGAIAGYSDNLTAENCTGSYINVSDISTTNTTNQSYVGALFGGVEKGSVTDCKANECYVSVKGGHYIFGIIAGSITGDISGCEVKAEGELLGSNTNTSPLSCGGIAGGINGKMKECRVTAGFLSNTIRSSALIYVGGLTGWLGVDGCVELCSVEFNDGLNRTVDGSSYPTSILADTSGAGNIYAGGLVGIGATNTKIVNCKYNGQSIVATNSNSDTYTGGIVGFTNGSTTEKIAAQGGAPLNRDLLPKRDGYKATWYTDSEFRNVYDFTQNVSADTTLYAKWEEGEEEQPEIWDGTVKQPAYNSSTKTYTVTNGAELAWIAKLVNGELELDLPIDSTMAGYTVELANDIYLNDISDWENWSDTNAPANSWTPIGESETNCFKGTFNGNNHTIKGIYINGNIISGLFGYLNSGIIKNLGVEYSRIDGSHLSNFTQCSAGITAYNIEGAILNCYNRGYVSGNNASGIAGKNRGSVKIQNCYNAGVISGDTSAGGVSNDIYNGIVEYCYNIGHVTAPLAGGIVVEVGTINYGTGYLSNCFNLGNISGIAVGGIAYKNSCSTIQYCYNVGSLSKNGSSGYLGGIVAENSGFDGGSGMKLYANVKYCYSTQSAIGKSNSLVSTTSVSTKTDAQMKSLSNLSGFSTSIWANDTNNTNNGYPYLTALKKYNITVVEDVNAIPINRVFANVNGIIYSQSSKLAQAGGIFGHVGSPGVETSPARNMLAISDRVSAVSSGSSYFANTGDIVGEMTNVAFDFSDIYSYSSMDLSAVNSAKAANASTSNISSARTLAQLKRLSFLRQTFGEPYQSLAYLEEHPDAVWVLKDGELPELYFNVLNDITVSETENGSIAVDRTRAVDDEIVNVTATPAEGYELNKIYVNGKEIDGTTFAVQGDSDVYATFIEPTPEFNVEINAGENATASLTNVDEADVTLSSVGDIRLFEAPVT